MADLDNPHAPRVFQKGRRISLLEAAEMHGTVLRYRIEGLGFRV